MIVNPFGALSAEILISIFEHCEPRTLISGLATCRQWNEVLKDSQFVYSILCYRYGYVHDPAGLSMSPSERLAALEAHVSKFNNVPSNHGLYVPLKNMALMAVSDGLLAIGQRTTSEITFHDTGNSTTQYRKWTVDIRIPLRSFSISRYRSLLVIVEIQNDALPQRIHLRSIDTGNNHPEASNHILSVPVPGGRQSGCTVKFSDIYIGTLLGHSGFLSMGVLMTQPINELAVWNWKTGDLVMRISASPSQRVTAFSFISPTQVLVGRMRFEDDQTLSMMTETFWLTLYSLPDGNEVMRFALPSYSAGTFVTFSITSSLSSIPSSQLLRPFYASPYDGITHIVIEPHSTIVQQSLPVAIVAYNSTFQSSKNGARDGIIVPWTDWGRKCHVMASGGPYGESFLHGLRMVTVHPTHYSEFVTVRIWDFGRHRDSINHITSRNDLPVVAWSEEVQRKEGMRFDEMFRGMPFREVIGKEPFERREIGALCIDEDKIYVSKRGYDRAVQVLTY